MNLQYAMAVAWGVGMLLAPDNLILLGNFAGSGGAGFVVGLFLTALAYIAHSRCYNHITAFGRGATAEFTWISHFPGPVAAVLFSVVPRVLAAVFLATATLVGAGFVFNEVFAQRFPNFAFAFLMLGVLLVINLSSHRIPEKIQILLSGTALAGIFILAAGGIFEWFRTGEIVSSETAMPSLNSSFSVLLLFVGFDLLIFSPNQSTGQPFPLQRYLITGLLISGFVFCLWGIASFLFVPSEKLAETSIPHILAAKKIWGQTGRVIMGLVVIFGTGAAVNALFMAVGRMIANLSREELLPFLPRFFNRSLTTVVLLTLATATMMALGVAGTDELDTYLRGSLILWLFNYAIIHLVLFSSGAQQLQKAGARLSRSQILLHGAVFLLMLTGSVVLIATDDNAALLIRYMSIIFFGVGLPAWFFGRKQSRRRGNPDLANK